MTKRTLEDAFKEGFLAGFMASGEGWNGEYPFDQNSAEVEDHEFVQACCDVAFLKFKKDK